MSIGIGAWANKTIEDDKVVYYEYGNYNLNQIEFRNKDLISDGYIIIPKECFIEPEIHRKIKKVPNGQKKHIIKRIPISVDYENMINNGLIIIENCSHCWKVTNDDKKTDVMVLHLLFHLFYKYQIEGQIPESISYET